MSKIINKSLILVKYLNYGFMLKFRDFKSLITTFTMKLKFNVSGVKYGSTAVFFGRMYLQIHPLSKVTIGNSCVFRSSFESNSIGLKQKCFLSAGKHAQLSIGNNCGLSGTVISVEKQVILGDRVFCGANVTICDSDRHPLNAESRFKGHKGDISPVIIGSDVWIGMNSIILKGVKIGSGTVIGANSIVNKDIPSNVIAAGVPAKVIRNIENMADNDNL